jgi:hypothetical protein
MLTSPPNSLPSNPVHPLEIVHPVHPSNIKPSILTLTLALLYSTISFVTRRTRSEVDRPQSLLLLVSAECQLVLPSRGKIAFHPSAWIIWHMVASNVKDQIKVRCK